MSRRPLLLGLDQEELKALKDFMNRCAREHNWRARLRGNVVYLSHQGRTIPRIAQELKCSLGAVYSWLIRFQKKGVAGLSDPPRPVKLTPQQVNQLMEISHWSKILDKEKRKEYRMRWTYRQMAQWIKDQWSVKLSHERIRQIVRQKLREY